MDKDGGKEEWGSIDNFPSGPVQVLGLAEIITRPLGGSLPECRDRSIPFLSTFRLVNGRRVN